jgi:hypothetical protein
MKLKYRNIGHPEEYNEFPKVIELTTKQKKYFDMVGIKNPMDLGNYTWWRTLNYNLVDSQGVIDVKCLIRVA